MRWSDCRRTVRKDRGQVSGILWLDDLETEGNGIGRAHFIFHGKTYLHFPGQQARVAEGIGAG